MLEIAAKNIDPTIHAQAWRVEFVEDLAAPADGVETIEIAEPRKVTAALAPLDASVALEQAEPETGGDLTVVWLSSGVKTPAAIEREADEWLRAGGARRREANVRADVRTVRVLWGENRALIYASPGDIRLALDATIRFALVQREALALRQRSTSPAPSRAGGGFTGREALRARRPDAGLWLRNDLRVDLGHFRPETLTEGVQIVQVRRPNLQLLRQRHHPSHSDPVQSDLR